MLKSRMKWVGLVGIVLSAFSLFTHFFLARFTQEGISEFQSSVTIFSWRPVFEHADFSPTVRSHLSLSLSLPHIDSRDLNFFFVWDIGFFYELKITSNLASGLLCFCDLCSKMRFFHEFLSSFEMGFLLFSSFLATFYMVLSF